MALGPQRSLDGDHSWKEKKKEENTALEGSWLQPQLCPLGRFAGQVPFWNV